MGAEPVSVKLPGCKFDLVVSFRYRGAAMNEVRTALNAAIARGNQDGSAVHRIHFLFIQAGYGFFAEK